MIVCRTKPVKIHLGNGKGKEGCMLGGNGRGSQKKEKELKTQKKKKSWNESFR